MIWHNLNPINLTFESRKAGTLRVTRGRADEGIQRNRVHYCEEWEVFPTLCDGAKKLVRIANLTEDEGDKKELVKKALEVDAKYRAWYEDNCLSRVSWVRS